jgi:hypothetical protein
MFITTLRIILKFLYILLAVTTVLIVIAFASFDSDDTVNVPLLVYISLQYIVNIALVVMLHRSIANLSFKKLSKANGYDDIAKQIKAVETQILKGFATLTLEESKKQFEEQYNKVMNKNSKKDTPFVIPTVDAEFVSKDNDEAFAEFDYTLEEYAHIAKESIARSERSERSETSETSETNSALKSRIDDFQSKTVVELKELCKEYGIGGFSKLKKAELIEALITAVR